MRDLSLHILDLMENCVRAGATVIAVTVATDSSANVMCVCIEDNGRGLSVTPEQALDPFYTTKSGKRIGLGLSLFKAAAEQAGGEFRLTRSALGGLAVQTTMALDNVNLSPLGDLGASVAALVCTQPQIEVRVRMHCDDHASRLSSSRIASWLVPGTPIKVAQHISSRIRRCLAGQYKRVLLSRAQRTDPFKKMRSSGRSTVAL